MNDIIITRKAIKDIAEGIYNNVDAYDYQDSGYMLKDIELAVAGALENLVERITSEFEYFAFAGDVRLYSSSLDFNPMRHCDAEADEMSCRYSRAGNTGWGATPETRTGVHHDD